MAFTAAELTDLRATLYAQYKAVITGQAYSVAGRNLQRARAEWLASELRRIDGELDALNAGTGPGIPVLTVIPRDL